MSATTVPTPGASTADELLVDLSELVTSISAGSTTTTGVTGAA